jgi:hypothetical protein
MQIVNHQWDLVCIAKMCLNHEWWTPKQKLVNPNDAADVASM